MLKAKKVHEDNPAEFCKLSSTYLKENLRVRMSDDL